VARGAPLSLSIVDGFHAGSEARPWVAADQLRGNPFLVTLDQGFGFVGLV